MPAGESLDPRRDIPFAMVATIVSVMIVMTLTQIVAQGVLPDLAGHATPIADAAAAFIGATGALLIGVGSVVSMTGNNAGQVLSGSRMLYALAEQGQLPRFLARIHPRYRTPANAILFTSAVALILALSGSFAQIAVVSALARLLMYAGSAAATLRLRSADLVNNVKPAGFRAPLGPAMPIAAIAVCAGLAAGRHGSSFSAGCGTRDRSAVVRVSGVAVSLFRHNGRCRALISRMPIRLRSQALLGLLVAASLVPRRRASSTQRFLYAALPGVGGGSNLSYGGVGILVFDIDHGHKFVKRIPLQGVAAASGRRTADRRRRKRSRASPRTPGPRGCTSPPAGASPRTIC